MSTNASKYNHPYEALKAWKAAGFCKTCPDKTQDDSIPCVKECLCYQTWLLMDPDAKAEAKKRIEAQEAVAAKRFEQTYCFDQARSLSLSYKQRELYLKDETTLTELGFSVETLNICLKKQIHTLGEALALTDAELTVDRNLELFRAFVNMVRKFRKDDAYMKKLQGLTGG